MGRLSRVWYIHGMALTPITAPTPSAPSPWYAVEKVILLTPDGVSDAWGILCEETQELLVCEDDPDRPWLAKTLECVASHIRYLNGITADFPTCNCPHD